MPQYRTSTPVRAIAVIDTNVVLDAWWFEDPRAGRLASAVTRGTVTWAAHMAMRDELQDVLTRMPFVVRPIQCERTLSAFDRLTLMIDKPATRAPMTCADPDDQCFVDLAWACRAAWLFTRDRALLELAPHATLHGCRILPPSAWPPDPKSGSSREAMT